jgi:hypothetical protein
VIISGVTILAVLVAALAVLRYVLPSLGMLLSAGAYLLCYVAPRYGLRRQRTLILLAPFPLMLLVAMLYTLWRH